MAGGVTAVDLDQLDPGAQYDVQVKALVQNREGTPVSVRITTRKSWCWIQHEYNALIIIMYTINRLQR